MDIKQFTDNWIFCVINKIYDSKLEKKVTRKLFESFEEQIVLLSLNADSDDVDLTDSLTQLDEMVEQSLMDFIAEANTDLELSSILIGLYMYFKEKIQSKSMSYINVALGNTTQRVYPSFADSEYLIHEESMNLAIKTLSFCFQKIYSTDLPINETPYGEITKT